MISMGYTQIVFAFMGEHPLKNKPTDELSATDVKVYLTYLAVNCGNQCFSGELFHTLH